MEQQSSFWAASSNPKPQLLYQKMGLNAVSIVIKYSGRFSTKYHRIYIHSQVIYSQGVKEGWNVEELKDDLSK